MGLVATSSARPMANSTATMTAPNEGNVAPTTTPAKAGPTRAGTPDARRLRPVGGQQLLGRQDPRQDRAVGGKEERRGDAEACGGNGHVPDLQGAGHAQHRDCRHCRDHVDGFDGDNDGALAEPVRGEPPTKTNATRPTPMQVGDQRQRSGVVVEVDDLKRHHDRPHAFGENRDRHCGDQQAVFAEPERCEHAPAAGVHRLLNVELRTHTFDGRRPGTGRVHRFSLGPAEIDAMARRTRTCRPNTFRRGELGAGVGEVGGAALLEGPNALAEVGASSSDSWPDFSRSSAARVPSASWR